MGQFLRVKKKCNNVASVLGQGSIYIKFLEFVSEF